MKRLYWRWTLAADEAYIRTLQAEGWTDDELEALRKRCQELRVKLATASPFFDRADWIVMRVALLAVLSLIVILLAGCKEDQPATFKPATNRDLITWGPDEHGVKCYRQPGAEGLSCVQVAQRRLGNAPTAVGPRTAHRPTKGAPPMPRWASTPARWSVRSGIATSPSRSAPASCPNCGAWLSSTAFQSPGMKYHDIADRLLANSVAEHTGHAIAGKPSECWLWLGNKHPRGYGRVTMIVGGKHKKLLAHRVSAKVFAGIEFDEQFGTWEHHCKQTSCIHPNHGEPMANAVNAGGRRNGRR